MNQGIPDRLPGVMMDESVHHISPLCDVQIRLAVFAEGRFDPSLLQRAIRLSLDAEPVLGCRFAPGWWRAHWERLPDLDERGLLRIEESEDTERALHRCLAETHDTTRGPQVAATLIRGESDVLCLSVCHTAADAGGTKEVGYLVADLYKRLQADPDFRLEPNLVGSRSMKQISARFGALGHLSMVRRAFRDMRDSFFPMASWTFPAAPAPDEGRTCAMRHIEGDRFAAVRDWARARSATLNDVIQAALMRAAYDLIRPGPGLPLRIGATADLRRYLPGERGGAICNLSGFVFPNIGTELGQDMDATCGKVREVMARLKDDCIGLGIYPSVTPLNKLLPLAWRGRITGKFMDMIINGSNLPPIITNMGPIDEARLDFGSVGVRRAYLFPPFGLPPAFLCGLSGFGESLTLSSGYCASSVDPQVAEGFLDRILVELPG